MGIAAIAGLPVVAGGDPAESPFFWTRTKSAKPSWHRARRAAFPPAKPALDNRVFLVVVDETEEMRVALRFAALRARSTGGKVAMLYVVEPSEFQHWMSVGDIMREEARTEAEQVLQRLAAEVKRALRHPADPLCARRRPPRREAGPSWTRSPASRSWFSAPPPTSATPDPGPGDDRQVLGRLHIPVTVVPDRDDRRGNRRGD